MTSQGERFRRRALRRGYKVDEVDAFLDRVEATLEGQPIGPPTASQEVDDVVFRVRFGGYDEWQVDVYLDRVARQLSELEERGVLGRAAAPDFEGRSSARATAGMEAPPGRGPSGHSGPGGGPRDLHDPRDPRDRHDPRDPRDPRGLDPHDPRDPRGLDPHDPRDPRDPRGLDPRAQPLDTRMPGPEPRGGPPAPPDPREMPDPRGRQPEPRTPARGAAPPARDRFAPPSPPPSGAPDSDGFGDLRGGDDEGFGHLAPRSDDHFGSRDDYEERSGRSGSGRRGGGLYSGLSDLSGDGSPPPPSPSPAPSGPPPGEDRYGAPPPPSSNRFERAAEDRYGPPPAAPPPPPDRFGGSDDRYGPPPAAPPPPPDRFGGPDDRYGPPPVAPPPADRFAPPPPMPSRGGEPERGYGADRMPPPRDERRPASPVDRFAPPPPGDSEATRIQPAVPPIPPPGRPPAPPAGRSPYGEPPDQYGRGGDRGGFTEPGRHGRPEMTTEMRAPDSPFTGDDISRLEQIRRSFQPRRFGSGYDPSQVDRLFDAVSATMTGRAAVPLSDAELDTSQFSLVQGGYFEAEVDAALREIRDTFGRRGLMRLDQYGRREDGRYR